MTDMTPEGSAPAANDRPHSLLIPHVRLQATHGWIGTRPGCVACVERFGPDYTSGGGS